MHQTNNGHVCVRDHILGLADVEEAKTVYI